VLGDTDFSILPITDTLVFGSLSLMHAHNINSADAAILATCLQFHLNPEEVSPDAVAQMLTQS
jgi:hypothetical protein